MRIPVPAWFPHLPLRAWLLLASAWLAIYMLMWFTIPIRPGVTLRCPTAALPVGFIDGGQTLITIDGLINSEHFPLDDTVDAGLLRLWDLRTGHQRDTHVIDWDAPLKYIAVAPDGKSVAAKTVADQLVLYNLEVRKLAASVRIRGTTRVVISLAETGTFWKKPLMKRGHCLPSTPATGTAGGTLCGRASTPSRQTCQPRKLGSPFVCLTGRITQSNAGILRPRSCAGQRPSMANTLHSHQTDNRSRLLTATV